ncbi:MAG TPA: SDR family oxidoreductase [Paracoccaceae bacterium]|nr:SDR family oxidoreductase [Paracoccaceae bacterium]
MDGFEGLSVVITGASSGAGRCTAHAFARRGARLALAARGVEPLEEAARECRELGGEAVAITADVTDPDSVRHLAEEAARRLGGIDVWVNNAGVGAVGRFHEIPIEAHRRIIETNLMGYLHGAHAALPYMLRQGRGVIVNNVSIGGFVPTPYSASYGAGKYGARAFSNALRQELADWPDIHVCAVYPFFMDTPGVQHGANYTGRKLQPAPPVFAPEKTAEAIVRLVHHPKREVIVGAMTKLAVMGYGMAPALVEWGLARSMEAYFAQAEPSPRTDGNLYASMPGKAAVHGGWRWSWPRGRSGEILALGLATALVAGLAAAGSSGRRKAARQRRQHLRAGA